MHIVLINEVESPIPPFVLCYTPMQSVHVLALQPNILLGWISYKYMTRFHMATVVFRQIICKKIVDTKIYLSPELVGFLLNRVVKYVYTTPLIFMEVYAYLKTLTQIPSYTFKCYGHIRLIFFFFLPYILQAECKFKDMFIGISFKRQDNKLIATICFSSFVLNDLTTDAETVQTLQDITEYKYRRNRESGLYG